MSSCLECINYWSKDRRKSSQIPYFFYVKDKWTRAKVRRKSLATLTRDTRPTLAKTDTSRGAPKPSRVRSRRSGNSPPRVTAWGSASRTPVVPACLSGDRVEEGFSRIRPLVWPKTFRIYGVYKA